MGTDLLAYLSSKHGHRLDTPGFLFGYFFKTQGRQNSTFLKTQAIFFAKLKQNIFKTQYFGNFYRDGPFFNVVNEVTTTSIYICECKLDRNSTFLQNSISFENSRKFQPKTQ